MRSQKKIDRLLDGAWYISYNSATYRVIGNGDESEEFINEANYQLQQIDRSDWYPVARGILEKEIYISEERLAHLASAEVINRKMNTDYLKVFLGGDT